MEATSVVSVTMTTVRSDAASDVTLAQNGSGTMMTSPRDDVMLFCGFDWEGYLDPECAWVTRRVLCCVLVPVVLLGLLLNAVSMATMNRLVLVVFIHVLCKQTCSPKTNLNL